MRLALLRATTASLLLAGAVALPALPASAAAGPHIDVAPPAVVGSGLNAVDLPVQVVNDGGVAQLQMRLRLTVTPVAGSAVRPLADTLVLSYEYGSVYRQLDYVPQGDALVATTPSLAGVDADGSTTVRLRIAAKPTSTAPHVDDMTVDVSTAALDDYGAVFATDQEPDRVALVEPRIEMTGWPARPEVGTPAVVTVSVRNTTPLAYLLLRPALAIYRSMSDQVLVERLDGDQWTPVSGQTSSYYWFYADGYPSLQPGESYTATLRITFTDDAVAGQQADLYHTLYTYFGQPIATDIHPYTVDPRA
jgi:hypothetical protein